jgi:hypothetical protein
MSTPRPAPIGPNSWPPFTTDPRWSRSSAMIDFGCIDSAADLRRLGQTPRRSGSRPRLLRGG